jgi:hypothetical protein
MANTTGPLSPICRPGSRPLVVGGLVEVVLAVDTGSLGCERPWAVAPGRALDVHPQAASSAVSATMQTAERRWVTASRFTAVKYGRTDRSTAHGA